MGENNRWDKLKAKNDSKWAKQEKKMPSNEWNICVNMSCHHFHFCLFVWRQTACGQTYYSDFKRFFFIASPNQLTNKIIFLRCFLCAIRPELHWASFKLAPYAPTASIAYGLQIFVIVCCFEVHFYRFVIEYCNRLRAKIKLILIRFILIRNLRAKIRDGFGRFFVNSN